jgi:hypothetical protein
MIWPKWCFVVVDRGTCVRLISTVIYPHRVSVHSIASTSIAISDTDHSCNDSPLCEFEVIELRM